MKEASMAVFRRYLTESEERRLLQTIAQVDNVYARRDHAWMRLMRYTGIRVGALAGLTVSDARQALREGYLQLRAEIQKGHRGHEVFVNKKAVTALRDLLRIRTAQGYPRIDSMPLVMSRKGNTALSVRSYQSRMQSWLVEAGLGTLRASPHWWRHTLGKRMMERSTSSDPRGVVQGVLGHASIASTAIYTHPDREDLEQALEEAA